MRVVTELLPGAARLLELHRAELPQKDELCGAFWGTLMLRLAGADVDQDAVAVAAGTILSTHPRDEDRPPGSSARRDYRVELPRVEQSALAGTAAAGVARAVEELSGGGQTVLTVAGPWRESTLSALVAAAAEAGEDASLVANVGTRFLWSSHAPVDRLLRYLETGADDAVAPDWDVGHFVGLLGTVTGPGGTAFMVADTYPVLGTHGVHIQPLPRVLRSLERPGQNGGGVLLAVPAAAAGAAERRLLDAGASIALWDNGSEDAVAGEAA